MARVSRHGALGRYTDQGCRCVKCRAAVAQYNKAWRARNKGTLTADDRRHGTSNGYVNYACRCRPCTDAWAATQRARRQAAAKLWR